MKFIIATLLFFTAENCFSQQFPDFKPLPYDENYQFLCRDRQQQDWYKKIKYLPLSSSGSVYLSFGGDIRYQYFNVKNEAWGDEVTDADGYLLSRLLLHADLHIGAPIRVFAQIQSSQASSRESASPVDNSSLDLHQAFVDLNLFIRKGKKLLLRSGRQELLYGSQRLVAVREGPNNRQSFDAGRLIYESSLFNGDLFYSHYVLADYGIFDDDSVKDRKFWGSYFVLKSVPMIQNIDLYYLGYSREDAVFDDGEANEKRHSVGARIWGRKKDWRYDTEAVYQFGAFGTSDITAWTVSINSSYRFAEVKFRPEIGLKAELVSGDKHNGDEKLQTFNPLFPKGNYFGLAALIGPSNLIDLHPSLNLTLSNGLIWGIDFDAFWRYSSNDGIYAPNVSLIYSGSNAVSKVIGQQFATDLNWNVTEYLFLRGEFTWFKAGDYLKEVGTGKDILFAGATIKLRF